MAKKLARIVGLLKQDFDSFLLGKDNPAITLRPARLIPIKKSSKVDLYHFSWSYLLTLAHILLFKNNNNIENEDQVEIMREVLLYFEHKVSGVCGFTQMKQGWKTVVNNINTGARLKSSDPAVLKTVESWHQEERDMALILSRKWRWFWMEFDDDLSVLV